MACSPVLVVIGAVLVIWAMVKTSVIGYYPDELVPQIIVPIVIGLPLLGVGNWMHKSVYDAEA